MPDLCDVLVNGCWAHRVTHSIEHRQYWHTLVSSTDLRSETTRSN